MLRVDARTALAEAAREVFKKTRRLNFMEIMGREPDMWHGRGVRGT
jgi:hypothetical protein